MTNQNVLKNKENKTVLSESEDKIYYKDYNAIDYGKLHSHLKGYMEGRNFYKALIAFNFAKKFHTGKRKDGVTPEFQHQCEIALFIITLKGLIDEEKVLVSIFLHDVVEDYDIEKMQIVELFGNKPNNIQYGHEIWEVVWKLTKVYKGVKKDPEAYFKAISECPHASIAKGGDRIHNLKSMIGVFKVKKMREYTDETMKHFLQFIKDAKNSFPEQGMAYLSIQLMLKNQIAFFNYYLSEIQDTIPTDKK